ncbi:MAG: hypothetical protein JW981_00785 [Anaerolineae bacterium]|nr:hypothetical protein [Anaerolineae bacterium]
MTTARIVVLTITLFCLNLVDFAGGGLNQSVLSNPLIYVVLCLLNSLVTGFAINNSRQRGWRLGLAVCLVFYALQSFLVGVEAYYLSDLLTPQLVATILINGAIVAAVFSYVAVLFFGKLQDSGAEYAQEEQIHKWSWLWKIPLAGIAYVFVFVLCGLLVFQPVAKLLEPIAAPLYFAEFQPENPGSILLFQMVRGSIWTLVTLPLLSGFRAPKQKVGMIIALLYAILMAPANLIPNPLAAGIRIAHTTEVFVENFIFGWIVVGLLYPKTFDEERNLAQ